MCGVCGWVDFDRPPDRETVRAMTATMAHRGPDEHGLWADRHAALGHRRLVVIDREGGRQPMGDGPVLVYSGEVYNHRELRAELPGCRTRSDTEVVLRGYLAWGEGVLDRLNGMYAFAIWDPRTRELLLARDRLGIKPLYYHRTPGGVVFGSEPKAIFASGLVRPAVDRDGLRELLSMVRTPGEAVYRDLREVPPGHLVRVRRGGLSLRRYWALEAREHRDGPRTTVATVRDLLRDAVERQLDADVPLCALLGGGLDSGAIVALAQDAAARNGAGRIRSFCVDTGWRPDEMRRTPDAPYAREVARHTGADHAELRVDARELTSPALRSAILRARDLPPLGDMDGSLYLLAREIRRHATVALSGEGADELFGGYAWFHDPACVDAATFPWLAMTRALGRQAVYEPRSRDLDVPGYQAQRYGEALAAVPRLPGEDPRERRMRELCHLHLTRFLPHPLDRKDRMGMAAGLEIRVPFLDHRLVEYVFNVPWRLKTRDGREKSLLRAAAGDLLPASVLARAKSPYPAVSDPAYHARLRDEVNALLADRSSPVLEILSRPGVRALAAMPPTGAQVVRLGLERVLHLDAWLRAYRVRLDL
ncbi:asparagine synthase (glutamine-hydrolyzing) [Bailinhaonella thermotolerans]|uniref:asparagine synthase (glutamine-hydrolyzing) n=1 Tax=Bailinhaonella thermotolerans TaxID=1070861 RepID=A0A3A4AFC5_9ACTN|nr:asparagine synthase (glutamine-hydrolyzing) [Bailinhaonella thermotolerans]RJL27221.1 asparagine synthase (glutamine-hydrolyzing) [Bailinhaonella thermotolerans]